MEYFTLNNGYKMPMAGIGTFMISPADAEVAVESALASGARLIDTANAYMNESATGRGTVDEMLKRLDTDYVDVLFLHQPTDNWREGYKNIEKAVKEGKVRSIGLSNFSAEEVQEAIDTMEIKPQLVQVEAHPYYPQTELKKKLAETKMGLMAWSPIGHGDKNLINEPVFTELAKKYGKSNVQIILRWHVQSGNVVFPGSRNPDHIKDNFDIFDFTLTEDEMAEIAKVDKNVRYYNATPELVASYKTMELKEDI